MNQNEQYAYLTYLLCQGQYSVTPSSPSGCTNEKSLLPKLCTSFVLDLFDSSWLLKGKSYEIDESKVIISRSIVESVTQFNLFLGQCQCPTFQR